MPGHPLLLPSWLHRHTHRQTHTEQTNSLLTVSYCQCLPHTYSETQQTPWHGKLLFAPQIMVLAPGLSLQQQQQQTRCRICLHCMTASLHSLDMDPRAMLYHACTYVSDKPSNLPDVNGVSCRVSTTSFSLRSLLPSLASMLMPTLLAAAGGAQDQRLATRRRQRRRFVCLSYD